MAKYILEACVDSVRSAIEAEKGGASRVELCSDLVIGGVSPSVPLFRQIRKYTDLKIRVLLRPRYGDYCYDSYEFEELREEVAIFREEGADGVVVGILNPDGTLNTEQLSELKQEARSMDITLHRAFDVCADPFQALEQAVEMGFDTILTSGQAPTAWEGRELLKELQEKSRGRIEILAASGIGPGPIRNLIPYTDISSYHMSGKTELESSMTFRKDGIGLGLSESSDYKILRTDSREIRTSVDLLKQAFGS